MASAAGALLGPGLLAAAANVARALGVRVAVAGVGLHRGHHLMYEVCVPSQTENAFGDGYRSRLLAFDVVECCVHKINLQQMSELQLPCHGGPGWRQRSRAR